MPSLTYYLGLGLSSLSCYASVASSIGVILPLYTWPSDTTWDPVYDALAAYPDVDFYVIVNPNSGPGSSSPPASEYVTGVETLNSYPNAHTLGYVRTNWANRDINEVKADIEVYSQWAAFSGSTSSRTKRAAWMGYPHPHTYTHTHTGTPISSVATSASTWTLTSSPTSTPGLTPISTVPRSNPGITLSGIFFDEAPQSSSSSELSYMQEAATYVQSLSAAFSLDSTVPTVVFNPGTAPAPEYFEYATNVVDFESTYAAWLEQDDGSSSINGVKANDNSRSAIIINSVPASVDYASVIDAAVSQGVGMIYLTSDFDYKNTESVAKVAAAIVGV
ncbi:Spherulation-specific family 4 [Aspergillus karnatakaensis]|uniref:spherulation-specific family 4 protein n=1 Tax=Aspergillus karnatakaensis TaxID=1810916 RepID=UPI003CCCD012